MPITFAKSLLRFYINFHFFHELPDFILSFLTGEFCNPFFPFFAKVQLISNSFILADLNQPSKAH